MKSETHCNLMKLMIVFQLDCHSQNLLWVQWGEPLPPCLCHCGLAGPVFHPRQGRNRGLRQPTQLCRNQHPQKVISVRKKHLGMVLKWFFQYKYLLQIFVNITAESVDSLTKIMYSKIINRADLYTPYHFNESKISQAVEWHQAAKIIESSSFLLQCKKLFITVINQK